MRAHSNQTVTARMAAGPDVRCLQGRLRVEPGKRLRKRRPDPVQERLSGRLRVEQTQHDHVEVGILDGVDDDERTSVDVREDLGDPLRPATSDVVEGDADDFARLNLPATLLGDEVAEV